MSKEIQVYAGKCKCKRKLDMRITEFREDEVKQNGEILGWIVFGVCKKCEKVYIQGLFMQPEEPVLNLDFIIDDNKIAEGVKDEEFKKSMV